MNTEDFPEITLRQGYNVEVTWTIDAEDGKIISRNVVETKVDKNE